MKTIQISEPLENAIYYFCRDELEWHTSQCLSRDYYEECKAQIALLHLLGYEEESKEYYKRFKRDLEAIKERG